MNWINTMIVEFNDDTAHTSLRPSFTLPCIHCRTFIADGGTASPLRVERHLVRQKPPPLPPPKVLTSPCPPRPIAPSFPADDRMPCMPTVSTISLCPFAIVLGIPVAATIVPSSFAHRRGGARARCWGGTGTWRWSAGWPRKMLHRPLPTFIIYNHCVRLNAFVSGRHPLSPPIHHQPQLLAFAALPSMVGCCILHPMSSSTHFHHRPLVQSLTLLSPTQRNK